ncbi:MAG: Tol-Pal system beta propeller repeat protein TolB [Candidatus Binatia bacterium]|nr:Tol-Pal system beta propeller repeat protein TolB [Candidatus Binatia bacterium]
MRRGVVLVWGLVAALAWAQPVAAQVRGLVSGPGQTAFPVVVSPLAGGGTDGAPFTKTLSRDLEISGLFRVLAARASATPDASGQVDYTRWASTGARFLVAGRLQAAGAGFALEVRLYDVIERRVLGGKRYDTPLADLPRMANRFADEILRLVTGTRGPFDSELAFVSTRGGRFKEIWVMRFDGGDLRQLTRNETINLSPSWAPNGRSLLYTSYRDGRPRLYQVDTRTQRRRRVLGGPGLVVGGRYSPNGRQIAVSREEARGNTEIVIVDNDGKTVEVVTRNEGIDVSPTWSPDGARLAFCSSRAGSPQIYVVDSSGGALRRVTRQGNYNTSPSWSPTGERIAYTGRVPGGSFQIFVVDLATGGVRQVTSGPGDNTSASWSPDGRYLVFSSTRAGGEELFVSDWRGRQQYRLNTGPGGDTSPAWSPWLN